MTDLSDDLVDAYEDASLERDEIAWEPTSVAEAHARFVVDDEAKAEWAMERIAKARAAHARIRAVCEARWQHITDAMERADARLAEDEEFFSGLLEVWWRREVDANPKGRKSLLLPSGKVKVTPGGERVEIDDPEAFCKAHEGSEFVRNKPEPDKNAIKAAWAEGRRPAGARLVQGEQGFKVEPVDLTALPDVSVLLGVLDEPF